MHIPHNKQSIKYPKFKRETINIYANLCWAVDLPVTLPLLFLPRSALIKATPFTDIHTYVCMHMRYVHFRAFYHLSEKLNKLINFPHACLCANVDSWVKNWTVAAPCRRTEQPPSQGRYTHTSTRNTPISMLIMRDTKLGFNKNVIIIHFEEFIDLQRLHMLNGRDMLMTRMGTLSPSRPGVSFWTTATDDTQPHGTAVGLGVGVGAGCINLI